MIVTTPQAGKTHDITVQDGDTKYGFMGFLDQMTLARANVVAASARVGTDPEGSEGLYNAWAMRNWQHGIDLYELEEDVPRVYSGDGKIATWLEGRITLASAWASSDASAGVATAPMIIDFKTGSFDYTIVGVGTLLRLYDDASSLWDDEYPTGSEFSQNVIWLHVHNNLLYVALNGANFQQFTGTKGSGWSTPSNTQALGFTSWDELVWKWLDDDIRSSSDDGATWSDPIPVGDPGNDISICYPLGDVLMIQKPEGFYYYDGTEVVPVWTEGMPEDPLNGSIGLEFEGFGYANVKRTIRKYTIDASGENFTTVTPKMRGSEDKERWGHGIPIWAFAGPQYLYVAFKQGEGATTNNAELLMWNGIGWHQILLEAGSTLAAAGYSNSQVWLLVNRGGVTYRKRMTDVGEGELADYPTSVFCDMETPWFDAGLLSTRKDSMTLRVFTRDCSATAYFRFQYEINRSGTWVTIGDVKSNPLWGTVFQIGGLSGAVANQMIRLRIRGYTTGATATPILESFSLRYIPMADSQHLYRLRVRVGEEVKLLPGYTENRTLAQQLNFLDQIENTSNMLILTDRFGRRYRVKNTDMRGDWPGARKDELEEQYRTMTFVNMFPGAITAQVAINLDPVITATGTVQATVDWLMSGEQPFVRFMNNV